MGFRFVPRFLFPNIDIKLILEMEFQLNLFLHIENFNNMSYLEFLWKYERLQELRMQENEESVGGISLKDAI